ncbi:hypothetical protein [Leucobacter sp. NPDC077196]|uniref:hypothetical protein n=1 Tax=Leucobacter sp. NPDC077196 TaxID=3154959 RepID=UPI0034174DA9
MSDLITLLTVAVTGVVGIVVALIRDRANRDARAKIAVDLEILDKLEVQSESREELKKSIDRRVLELAGAGGKTRDFFGISLATLFIGLGVAMLYLVQSLGNGYWIFLHLLTALFFLFGVVGLGESVKKTHRDERGRKVTLPPRGA